MSVVHKICAVIPARYASTRFPGKPLALIKGKSMLQRVYEQAKQSTSLSEIIVATDHDAIALHANSFGAKVVMTSPHHASGTDRIAEVMDLINSPCDIVINIQGDEPFINPEQINILGAAFEHPSVDIATMAKPITESSDYLNSNVVKVVMSLTGNALYFSRSPIPHFRNGSASENLPQPVFKHLGMYAYRKSVLQKISKLPVSSLEMAEQLEQLRWLENGFVIRAVITHQETIAIDTPEDIVRAELFLSQNGK
jgi:3-deoxy-manno-octulosonate cytidylyltransferase (CMP-KDO synthetase)